jgi:hypothetical protein
MWELKCDHSLRIEQDLQSFDKIIKCRNVREDIVADDQIGTNIFLHETTSHGFTEELYSCRDVLLDSRFSDIGCRLDSKNRDFSGDEML